jgi:hypothetical protein
VKGSSLLPPILLNCRNLIDFSRGGLSEILCKPKILPLKSVVLEQIQKIEKANDEDEEQSEAKNA